MTKRAPAGRFALGRVGQCDGAVWARFTITGDSIATITGFPSPDLFDRFGLPPDCPSAAVGLVEVSPAEGGDRDAEGGQAGRDQDGIAGGADSPADLVVAD